MIFLIPLQVLARFYCQSLRRYQKNQKYAKTWRGTKKKQQQQKKNNDVPIFGPGDLQDMKIFVCLFVVFFFCFCFFGTSSGVVCQSLRRYKKNTTMPKPEEVPKTTKKTQDFRIIGPSGLQDMKTFFFMYLFRFWHFWAFLVPLQALAKNVLFGTFSGLGTILLPKPEEVPKQTKTKLKVELLDSKLSL